MTDTPDADLLAQYTRDNSGEAFAAIVERHIGLVHSVALRHTANPQHAEDITQAVFIILARKASSLSRKTILPGWLYHTARLTASNIQRAEFRRIHREQEAYMQSTLQESAPEVSWTELAPLLDEAMARLGAHERDALVLRYFQNKSLAEVGAVMGLEERTAQKRIYRALEKLRNLFSKRGVNSTAETIAGAISAHSIQAVPAILAKSVTAVAITKGATATISTLTLIKGALKIMAWTNTKTAILASAALIIAAGTSVVVVRQVHAPRIIPAAFAGLPQTLDELNAWYVEPPAGQNAATFELQGIKARQIAGAEKTLNLPVLGEAPTPSLSAPLSPAMRSALGAFLQRNQATLQFFNQGERYGQSRYPIDLTMGPNTMLTHLAGIKSGMQMEEMAAIDDADNQDGQRAAEDILAGIGLARSLDTEPVTISQLVRAAGILLTVQGSLQQVVNHTTLPLESLSALANTFQNMEAYDTKGEGFNRALVAEEVINFTLLKNREALLQLFKTSGNMGQDADQDRQMIDYLHRTSSLTGEQDYFETTFQQLMSARQETFPDRMKDAEDVLSQRAIEAKSRGYLFNAVMWDGLQNITIREARCLADLRLAVTAIALEQFRAANGNQYPATLTELAPKYLGAIPADPFDGKPLRYRKQVAGYVLYSVGQSLKDNGGRQENNGGGNIPFTVISPPAD